MRGRSSALTKFLATDAEPVRLDRFELVAELASGGMATVYLARLGGAGGFQRLVAIKRLHPHLARDHEFTQMFLDEARLAARLHHPHVVAIIEIGESATGYYLVMEYVEGDTLARLMARSLDAERPLPPTVAIRIGLDVLSGLHAAHELLDDDNRPLQIVHRDVSPQNILIGVDGTARITDFGVARAATRLTTTRSGQLKGKIAYMAPEQARGKSVDRRADIFAMGIVLWETLAQRRLFKGEGEADTLNRVLYEPIPSLGYTNPDLPPEIAEVVMRALDRDPENRYATAAELGETLESAARRLGLLGTPRDVAAHLDSVIGSDVGQQRDAVRAWLARSEPSRPQLASPPLSVPPPPLSSRPGAGMAAHGITHVNAGRTSHAGYSSHPPPPRLSHDPSLSGVSSAGIAVPSPPQPTTLPPPATLPPSAARPALWVGGALALLLLTGLGAWGALRVLPAARRVVLDTTDPPPHDMVASETAPALPSASALAPVIEVDAGVATPASALPRSDRRPPPRRHGPRPPVTGGAGTAPTALPDDLSHNPYR